MRGRRARACALVVLAWGIPCIAAVAADPLARTGNPQIQSLLRESSRPLFRDRLYDSQLARLQATKRADASLQVLVVGVDFSDSLMVGRDNTMPEFAGWPEQTRRAQRIVGSDLAMFSAHDAVYFDLQMRKVNDYFQSVSFGRFSMSWSVYPTIVNVGRSPNDPRTRMGWYGDDDSSTVRLVELSQRVIDAIDPDVDFSNYDTLVLIHAGAGQETDILGNSPEQIFSNYLDRRDFESAAAAGLVAEPRLQSAEGDVEHVLVLPESESQDAVPEFGFYGFFGTRGVYCFEFGLRMGMLNLGDFTPAGRPDSQGIGNFGLMGYGLFTGLGIVPSAPSAFNRQLMGWVDRVDVPMAADLRLGAMGPEGDAVSDTLLVRVPINAREYFLVEYRLQDPNGDLFFSFDDLNGNRLPDYFDADSANGDGTPTGPYVAGVDSFEVTLGAEWDWFMSENGARSPDGCMRAGGSGLYIWHVDERVILDAVFGGDTTPNSDRARRGVDVEEADGIQDLDSPRPSNYFLGWDGDSWRGEGNSDFGPDSDPSSDSADGTPTGIRIHRIQDVSTETTRVNGFCSQIVYRKALRFRVDFEASASAAPSLAARRMWDAPAFAGELKIADLGISATDPTADGIQEIVHAGRDGRIYAWRGDLSEWIDGDADAASVGVLAQADAGAGAPSFVGSPAIADLDGDDRVEILAHADDGLYAFGSDGAEWRDGDDDPSTFGRAVGFDGSHAIGPPLIVGDQVFLLRAANSDSLASLVRVLGSDGTVLAETLALDGRALSDGLTRLRVGAEDRVACAVSRSGEMASVRVHAADAGMVERARLEGVSVASGLPLSAAARADDRAELLWLDVEGMLHSWVLGGQSDERRNGQEATGAPSAVAVAPARAGASTIPVYAYAAGRSLLRLDPNLRAAPGHPYLPRYEGEATSGGAFGAASLLVDLDGDGVADLLWQDPTGRAHALSAAGRAWGATPFVGPAEPLPASAVGDLDGDGRLEWVLGGAFDALVEIDAPARSALTRPVSELAVYQLGIPSDRYAPWAQPRADAGNGGWQPLESGAPAATGPSVLEPNTLRVHPHPASGPELRVRVALGRSADAECALYNLEGEVVARGPRRRLLAGGHYDEFVDISHLASGFYLCQVRAGGEIAQIAITVVR